MNDVGRRGFLQHAAGGLLAAHGAVTRAAAQPATQVFYNPLTLAHEPPNDHPERPARVEAALEAARALTSDGRLSIRSPRLATDDDILLVHTPDYLKRV